MSKAKVCKHCLRPNHSRPNPKNAKHGIQTVIIYHPLESKYTKLKEIHVSDKLAFKKKFILIEQTERKSNLNYN